MDVVVTTEGHLVIGAKSLLKENAPSHVSWLVKWEVPFVVKTAFNGSRFKTRWFIHVHPESIEFNGIVEINTLFDPPVVTAWMGIVTVVDIRQRPRLS